MKTKKIIIPLFIIVLISMACSIGYEGVNFGSDPDIEKIEDLTATAEGASIEGQLLPPPDASTPEPLPASGGSQGSESQASMAGVNEYSVTATNFDCICQVNGNTSTEFVFNGDQLEVSNGATVDVYEKIAENTYKRSWMGYYILVSGEGDQKTETRVDEERSVIIIFNDEGYIMEHYQGSSPSPCCYHTFTKTK